MHIIPGFMKYIFLCILLLTVSTLIAQDSNDSEENEVSSLWYIGAYVWSETPLLAKMSFLVLLISLTLLMFAISFYFKKKDKYRRKLPTMLFAINILVFIAIALCVMSISLMVSHSGDNLDATRLQILEQQVLALIIAFCLFGVFVPLVISISIGCYWLKFLKEKNQIKDTM